MSEEQSIFNSDPQKPSTMPEPAQGPAGETARALRPAGIAGRGAQSAVPHAVGPAAPYGYEDFSEATSRDEAQVMDYLRVLHKRRWTAVGAFAVLFGLVVIYTFTATPIYEAKAQVLIENENPNVIKFEEVYDQNKATNDYYQTQYRILQSRLLARRTIEAAKLWQHDAFAIDADGGVRGAIADASNFVKQLFESRDAREAHQPSETAEQSRVIDKFLSYLSISPIRNSRLVDVKYRARDPRLAANVTNALAKAYIEQNLEFKYLATQEANEFLRERMGEQRQALEQSEEALQKYREQTGAVSLEDRQNIVVQRLADLNAAVTRARTDRIAKQSLWNQIREIQNDRAALDTVPAILGSNFVQTLKADLSALQRQQAQLADKLGEKHPEMVKVKSAIDTTDRRLNAEIQKVIEAVRNDYEAAVANERGLQNSMEQQRAEAQELNRAAIQYGVLQRDSASNRQLFEGLLQRSKETGIQGELKTSNIRIVDQAEIPRKPASPNKVNNLLFALFGGAVFGIGLAFFFEYLDNRIKSPEEIKAKLGLAFLGIVPSVNAKAAADSPLINNGVPHHFSEAFRTIRTNVLFSSADAGPKSIVVTSTAPGEGKTVVSANLALSMAMAGQRVLVIDADMRRPKVHEMFRFNREPGLSNVIVGTAQAKDAVRRTSVPNLWVMTAGKHPPNPAELLGSRRFKEFLTSLGEHFEWIVLDSPPVMAVTDSAIIANAATGVVFVVGAEMTSKGAAKAALDQLDAAKARYLGSILNRVDLQRNSYYYSRYYRREYSHYYESATSA